MKFFFEFLKEHFNTMLTMIGVLTLIAGIADLYVYFTYIKGQDDILVGLFLVGNALAIVFVTSIVSTFVEVSAILHMGLEYFNHNR